MMRWVLVWLALAGAAAADAPVFVDESSRLPIRHIYNGPWEHFVGGGLAVLDCDADGDLDMVAAGGVNPLSLFRNTSEPGGALSFLPGSIPQLKGATGVYPIDIDGDAVLDLAILRAGENAFWKGGADCTFMDATDDWGIDRGDEWSTAFSATWEGDNDRPTLAVGNYVDRDDPTGPFGACDDNTLFRPDGDIYSAAIPLSPSYCTLSMLFSDWSRTGRRDLRVSNDRHYYLTNDSDGSEQMWRMPDLVELGEAEGWDPLQIWGMGIASQDLSGDGRPEVMLTSMGDQVLQLAVDNGFEIAPYASGTTAHRPYEGDDLNPSTGWHVEFGDVDNDGLEDLFIAKGNVEEMKMAAMEDPNNLLMQTDVGTFQEAGGTAGVGSTARSRGATLADLNNDGWLDLAVVNRKAPMEVYRNPGLPDRNWVAFDIRQEDGNRFAIGAWVEVNSDGLVRTKELTIGGGHAGGRIGPVHFGLGSATGGSVRVIWPDGTVGDWQEFSSGMTIKIER